MCLRYPGFKFGSFLYTSSPTAVGLDVYKNEPNLNPGYLKHKSAFILPHLGSATKETRTAMANLAIDNMDEFFKTGGCIRLF